MNKNKIVSAFEAAACIPDEAVVGIAGVNIVGVPLELIDAISKRYETEKHPKSITVINSANNGGIHLLGVEGLIAKYIAGFPTIDMFTKEPGFIDGNKIPVFSLTQGIAAQFYNAQAAKIPYLMRSLKGTYLDPENGGGCANEKAAEIAKTDPIVKTVSIGGETFLHIDMPKVNVVLIRASAADTDGNLSDADESVRGEILPMAMAAHNNGGLVIAQVNKLLEPGAIDAADVRVPGMLVDKIVICTDQEQWAPQNLSGVFYAGMTGRYNVSTDTIPFDEWKPTGEKLVLARRAVLELQPGSIVNYGLGAPMGVPYVAAMEGVADMYYPTVELGAIGGYTSGGRLFSGAFNPKAFLRHDEMFSFINGGGLDMTFLGAAEIDESGSVNVTRIAGKTNGSGGFMNISSNTQKIVFMCSHTAGGKPLKFIPQIEQVAFNAAEAIRKGQDVTYITERAVFKLIDGKVTLIEIAPGLDIEKDVIGTMGFRPAIASEVKTIPEVCYTDDSLGLLEKWSDALSGNLS